MSQTRPAAAAPQAPLIPGARMLCRSVRLALGWTQAEMAEHLGVSRKAVESYEQRWRRTPVNVERLALLFLGCLKFVQTGGRRPRRQLDCWALRRCPMRQRRLCSAWLSRRGDLCWLLAGTACACGRRVRSWKEKWERCKRCAVLAAQLADLPGGGPRRSSRGGLKRGRLTFGRGRAKAP